MSERVRGSVINVHNLGAIVRLEDGRLVAAPIGDVNKNRAAYTRALERKDATLPFDLVGKMVVLAQTRIDEVAPTTEVPALTDPSFEAQIAAYLKSTEEWAPPDRPQPFERHLVRKRHRAKLFEGRAE
ncbi:MAG TPA: hypothetical protein VHT05_09835 [Candidatus Elarobacter sp.]|jgi:hypothetical protein|nr:hypothetical protein [Candidatus Elarobacter sp.]